MANIKKINPARIIYQCRRGMLELDLILGDFLANGLETLTEDEQLVFLALLDYPDPLLYAYLMGHLQPDTREEKAVVDKIRSGTSS